MKKKIEARTKKLATDVGPDEETDLAALDLEELELAAGGFRIGVPRGTIRMPTGKGECTYA